MAELMDSLTESKSAIEITSTSNGVLYPVSSNDVSSNSRDHLIVADDASSGRVINVRHNSTGSEGQKGGQESSGSTFINNNNSSNNNNNNNMSKTSTNMKDSANQADVDCSKVLPAKSVDVVDSRFTSISLVDVAENEKKNNNNNPGTLSAMTNQSDDVRLHQQNTDVGSCSRDQREFTLERPQAIHGTLDIRQQDKEVKQQDCCGDINLSHQADNSKPNQASSYNNTTDRASQRTRNNNDPSKKLNLPDQIIVANNISQVDNVSNIGSNGDISKNSQDINATTTINHAVHSLNHNNSLKSNQIEQPQQQAFENSNTNNTNKSNSFNSLSRQHIYPNQNQEDLPFIQKLFFTRWPIYALTICIMAALIFAIFSSVLSVYLTCGTNAYSPSSSLSSRTSEALIDTIDVAASSSSANVNNFTRLPSSLWPIHYDLFIQPYLKEPFDFDGKVSIRIKCTVATNNISLHARDLELDRKSLKLTLAPNQNSSISLGNTRVPSIVDLTQDKQLQYSIIHLDEDLTVGREYIISIDFKGLLNDDLAGFYRIKYDDQKGQTTWIAATQFQATDARKAFPCFDEPLYKATFGITIKHWTNMTALSNMPLVSSNNDEPGWVTDKFAVSHRMSTYLVAYAVTNFESKTLGNITVWARPAMINSADYALNISGKILKHYEKFFGIDFPLPKMDMIALPDFNAGAMENWGLITYRETAMLYDEKISSLSNKQRVATVVAHELAHQWFGNLVTPKWWDDLWLNEGFASYVEYIGVDHVEPDWKMLDQFVVEENQDVLKADSLSTSHQISIPVTNPDEITEIFDRISYGKGASIIRMMNHFLTEDVLKAGLRNYLAALKYGNAEQSDLWHYLTEVQSEMNVSKIVDVKKVMNSWTLQTGFPLVTLTRDYKKNSANLEQNRFQILSKEGTAIDLVSKWEIPITMTSAKNPNWEPRTRLWMHQDDDGPVPVDSSLVPNTNQWMLINVDQVGYYRVNYDAKNWQLLIEQLVVNHTAINPINRAQILDDIFDLAKNSLIDYKFAMNATKYLKKETDFLAWDTILRSFVFIDDMLQRAPIYGEWKEYVSELIEEFYNKYKDQSWTIDGMKESHSKNDVLAMYNRVNAISWACTVNQHCIKKARVLFDEWKNTGVNNIDPSLRGILYCNVIENGDKSDWEFLWKKYVVEQSANEKDRLLRSMACSKELWILSRYLEWIFDKTKPIRRQDGSFVFRAVARNNYGRDVAFNFLRERWQTIKDYYGKSSFSFSGLIKSVSSSLNTNFELQQLISFYKSIRNDVGTAKRSFLQSIEEVESNVAWMSKYYKTLESWIRETRGKPHL